jgi:transposase
MLLGSSYILQAYSYTKIQNCSSDTSFSPWHTVYVRINRWAKNGVLERVFHGLQEEQITNKGIRVVSLDSTSVKAHPDATGVLKKTARRRWEHPVAG